MTIDSISFKDLRGGTTSTIVIPETPIMVDHANLRRCCCPAANSPGSTRIRSTRHTISCLLSSRKTSPLATGAVSNSPAAACKLIFSKWLVGYVHLVLDGGEMDDRVHARDQGGRHRGLERLHQDLDAGRLRLAPGRFGRGVDEPGEPDLVAFAAGHESETGADETCAGDQDPHELSLRWLVFRASVASAILNGEGP